MKAINLLPAQLRLTRKQSFVLSGIGIACVVVVIGFYVLGVQQQTRIEEVEAEKQQMLVQQQVQQQTVAGIVARQTRLDQFQQVVRLLQKQKKDWYTIITRMIDPEVLPPRTKIFQIEFDESAGTVGMEGQVPSTGALQSYVSFIRGMKSFEEVKPGALTSCGGTDTPGETCYQFSLKLVLWSQDESGDTKE